jgi:hypothetical protein
VKVVPTGIAMLLGIALLLFVGAVFVAIALAALDAFGPRKPMPKDWP